MTDPLTRSRARWNRQGFDLQSDEVFAQILDRGEMAAWRELYRLAHSDVFLRARILRLTTTVPLALSNFWRAAMVNLGETVDWNQSIPDCHGTDL